MKTWTWLKKTSWTVVILSCLCCACEELPSTDIVEVLSESVSPDGSFIATHFRCTGGGAAGYVYENVQLHKPHRDLDPRDCLMGKHATWNAFSQIKLQWMNSQHLVITLHEETHPAYRENNTEKIRSKDGVTIDYILLSPVKAE